MEDLAPGLHSGQGRVAAGGGPGGSERKEHNPYYQHRRKLRQEQRKERHPWWTRAQINKIRSQVLGNFFVDHLGLDGDLAGAQTALERFTVVVDLSHWKESSLLLRCVLGWRSVTQAQAVRLNVGMANAPRPEEGVPGGLGHSDDNLPRLSTDALEGKLSASTRARLEAYLHKDLQLFATAQRLFLEHYQNATRIST
jgi:hypothetical protein